MTLKILQPLVVPGDEPLQPQASILVFQRRAQRDHQVLQRQALIIMLQQRALETH